MTTTKDIARVKRETRRQMRHETAAWQACAAGLFALSLLTNMALGGLYAADRQRWVADHATLRDKLEQAETVRDHAVRELGALAAETAREREARAEQAAAYEAMGVWTYAGEFTVTAYCPCEACCGRWADGVTASGLPAGPGIVAVDPDVVPLGSTVIVDGQKYLAADTGVTGNRIDICVTDHSTAEMLGARTADVWVEES